MTILCIHYEHEFYRACTGFVEAEAKIFHRIEFDVWLISPTIELARIQGLDRSRFSCGATELSLRTRHTPNNWETTI